MKILKRTMQMFLLFSLIIIISGCVATTTEVVHEPVPVLVPGPAPPPPAPAPPPPLLPLCGPWWDRHPCP